MAVRLRLREAREDHNRRAAAMLDARIAKLCATAAAGRGGGGKAPAVAR